LLGKIEEAAELEWTYSACGSRMLFWHRMSEWEKYRGSATGEYGGLVAPKFGWVPN
jgi:hypothetical protein